MPFPLNEIISIFILWLPALLCGAFSGCICGTLGAYIVGMRIPFIGICVAHAALAGAVFASLFGIEGQLLMIPALLAALAASFILGITNPRWIRMDDNVMMSVLFSGTMGLAFLGLGLFSILAPWDGRSSFSIYSTLLQRDASYSLFSRISSSLRNSCWNDLERISDTNLPGFYRNISICRRPDDLQSGYQSGYGRISTRQRHR